MTTGTPLMWTLFAAFVAVALVMGWLLRLFPLGA